MTDAKLYIPNNKNGSSILSFRSISKSKTVVSIVKNIIPHAVKCVLTEVCVTLPGPESTIVSLAGGWNSNVGLAMSVSPKIDKPGRSVSS